MKEDQIQLSKALKNSLKKSKSKVENKVFFLNGKHTCESYSLDLNRVVFIFIFLRNCDFLKYI